MRYDEQILKLEEYSVVFLSETTCVITKDIDKALTYETMKPIDVSKMLKNSRTSIGFSNFYFSSKNKSTYLYVKDRKYSIEELNKIAYDFESLDLKSNLKYLIYKKGQNIFICLPDVNFTYLNRNNVVLKQHLGNILYLRDVNKQQVIEKVQWLFKLGMPIGSIILDDRVIEQEEIKGVLLTYKNDLSPNNPFYFLDNSNIKISNTGAKPVITYGFSRNNTLNYFDVNMSNNFQDFNNFLSHDLNYNKNYFNEISPTISTADFLCRLTQVNCFAPFMFFDDIKANVIDNHKDEIYFKAILKYVQLRHRLIPYLYSVFKSKRLYYKDIYRQNSTQILFADSFLINPITSELDKVLNQNFVTIEFDDIYYDFENEEKMGIGSMIDSFAIDKMPLYVKAGSIIPLAILNDINDYEVLVYPGASKEFILHYDEYLVDEVVHHAYTTFNVVYEENKMVFTIKPHLIDELAPSVFRLNFVNVKKSSNVVVKGSEHKIDYNSENKYLLIEISDTNSLVEIEITNEYGIEIDRSREFLDTKLTDFFENINVDVKLKALYKYKVRPYLHEDLKGIVSRIDKYIKFLNKKQKKNLYKLIGMYKK